MHGERVVLSPKSGNPTTLHVLDFGMSASRQRFPGDAAASGTRCIAELHSKPSTLVTGSFVATTALPYRKTVCAVDGGYRVFFVDENHVVGVNEGVCVGLS